MAAAQALSFNNIRCAGSPDVGQFRVMNELFGWKNKNPSAKKKVLQYVANDLTGAEWTKISPRESQIRFVFKNGSAVIFLGFRDADYESLAKHFESQMGSVRLKRVKLSTRGWHWGDYQIEENDFVFNVENYVAFRLHIPDFASVNNRAKNDLSLEFNPDEKEDGAPAEGDVLLEMRFAVPPGGEEEDPAAQLRRMLLEKTGDKAISAESVCMVQDLRVLVPSARFDMNMFKTAMKLHGKSNDFIVPYKTIQRMFLLPGPQPGTVSFLLSLNTPLRKGNTRHPNVIIQFDEKKVVDMEIRMDQAELDKVQDSAGSLQRNMTGKQYEIVTRLFKALVNKSVTVPGDFKSSGGEKCFRCSNKALNGHLYPLNKLLIFIPKPVIIIKYEDIVSVEFGRTSGAQTRMFEFRISVKGGTEYEFSSVDRHEYQPLVDFMQKNNVRVRNLTQDTAQTAETGFADADLPSDESEDEDFEAQTSESEEDDDDDDQDEDERTPHKKRKVESGGGAESTPQSSSSHMGSSTSSPDKS